MIHYGEIGTAERKTTGDCGRDSTADERAADISATKREHGSKKRGSVPYKRPSCVQTAGMANKKRKRTPKAVLKLPDLEQSKSVVLNSLTSLSSQRPYDHAIREFIEWYCCEPRLAFNKTVVTRYGISLEQAHYPSSTGEPRLSP
jgi:hypothetical protein